MSELRDWIKQSDVPSVWSTDNLIAEVSRERRLGDKLNSTALAGDLIEFASGAMVLQLGMDQTEMVIFFRPQYVTEVRWGGNPEKSAEVTEDGLRLSPRKSFALWTETVKAHSRPWSRIDQVIATDMHAGLLRLLAQRSAELLRINEELLRVNSDLDSFAYAASHDLKEPLRTINQTIFFLERALKDQQPEEFIAELRPSNGRQSA